MKIKFPVIAKTATYGIMHMVVSFFIAWFVAYYMTGDFDSSLHVALGISLIEPSIQICAYYLHEKAWTKWGKSHPDQAAPEWHIDGCIHGHHHGHSHGPNHNHDHSHKH